MFLAFRGADACLAIKDSDRFGKLLTEACEREYPGWLSARVPVHYFDPYEMTVREVAAPMRTKDFRFAYQQEWRFVCMPENGSPTEREKFLKIGPLDVIAELFDSTRGIATK
jgi:hypothetical protein